MHTHRPAGCVTQRDETASTVFDVLPPGFPPRGPASKREVPSRGSRRQRKARRHKSPSPRRTWKIASSPYTRRLDARRVDIGEKRDYAKFEERWALHRLGPVGRLDKATTGLLLFTDDGGLAKRLVAAGTCRKTYVLDVAGDVTDAALASLARPLDDVTLHTREAVRTAPADVAVLRRDATAVFEAASVLSFNRPRVDGVTLGPRRVDGVRGAVQPAARRWRQPTTTTQATLEVTIAEGRNRQIRRLAARADLQVTALHRVRLGPLALGDLPVGAARGLTPREVEALLGAVGLAGARGPPRALPCAAAPELRERDVAAALDDLVARA